MRNLVVCADGTWNKPEQKDQGLPAPTNVVKIYNALSKNSQQLAYYHPGVGVQETFLKKIISGIEGSGLDKNIKSAYKWLCATYKPKDHIFLFGFSRGAFTVRSVAGMIHHCGLLDLEGLNDDEIWTRVDKAFKAYRNRKKRIDWAEGWKFHPEEIECKDGKKHIPIHFLGVWDTVGTLGIPDNLYIPIPIANFFANLLNTLIDNPKRSRFHDVNLRCNVIHARHAVAIDEKRAYYVPTLWQENGDKDIKQLWFPGVHANVGGGYAHTGLSDIALAWMIEEAQKAGLLFNQKRIQQIHPNPKGVLYDSASGLFGIFPTMPRNIPPIIEENSDTFIHRSALLRQKNPPIVEEKYHETHFLNEGESVECTIYAKEIWNDVGIYLEANIPYTFEAKGHWMDGEIKYNPAGNKRLDVKVEEIPHKIWPIMKTLIGIRLGNVSGFLEKIWKRISHDDQADFWLSKREEQFPWFALLGAIANGGNPDIDGTPQLPEIFKIGKRCTYTPKKSGYFYPFVNDSWSGYLNNRGHITLKITHLAKD